MSMGKSSSESEQAPTGIDPIQAEYLQKLWGQSQGALNQANQNVASMQPGVNAGINQLLNPGVNPQLEAYSQNVQRNFTDNILPTIQGNAGMANAIGGSRQGVAEGVAAGYANQDITNMASNLYGQDMNRMLSAIQAAPGAATMGQQPYVNQGAILGNPTVVGGGGSSSSKGKSIGLS